MYIFSQNIDISDPEIEIVLFFMRGSKRGIGGADPPGKSQVL